MIGRHPKDDTTRGVWPWQAVRRRATGAVIVVAGPDGSGKTLVAEHLIAEASRRGRVLHLHHRPHLLPGASQHDGPVTEPHRHSAYPPPLAALKLAYVFLDYAVGWALTIGPTRRAGGTVILERGWWDMAVDPLRYRLTSLPRLHRLFARLLPRPDRIIVLDAPSDVLLARKAELPAKELERQRAAWRSLSERIPDLQIWDATRPAAEVLSLTSDAAPSVPAPHEWVALPPHRSNPRWVLPRGPRRTTRASLRIHRPVSLRALTGWSAANALAASGALRKLPRATPEAWILDRIGDLIPAGGSVATASSNHANRAVALIMDGAGAPQWIVKVSSDPTSDAELAAEAAALQRYAPLLEAPLHAPRLHRAAQGLLVFVPIEWRHQAAPWRLDPAVASALGALHRVEKRSDGTGIGHGDVAPWNLIPENDRWYLIDWEAAGTGFLPYHDVHHHLIQCHALLGRPRAEAIVDGIRGRGWIGATLEAYAAAGDLEVSEAEHYLIAYLHRSLPSADDLAKADNRRGRRARLALLARLEGRVAS